MEGEARARALIEHLARPLAGSSGAGCSRGSSSTPQAPPEVAKAQIEAIRTKVALVKSPELGPDTPPSDLPLGIPAAYWLDLRAHSVTDVARGLGKPILVLQGGRDYQVTAADLDLFAHERGKQDAVKERFFRAYLSEGEPIGDPETLVRLAAETGLDPEEVRAALASDTFAAEVRAEEQEARDIGITGVPFFLLAGRYAISGAQPADLFLRALTQAWTELAAKPATFEEGAACGPDGCC